MSDNIARAAYAYALEHLNLQLSSRFASRDTMRECVEDALAQVLSLRSRRAQDILPARMEHVAERARREADQWEALMGATMPACVRLREIADEAMELARMVRAGVEP